MAYVSLYRKWRPQTFEEVIGQEYVTRTLSNSLRNGSFAHAYLFSGPRGTGKTSTARILAKALNCEQGPTPDPCNQCRSCREITEGTSVDVIEIDAASTRGIDGIRELRDRVIFSPASARIKVYVLDESHMLTKEAFNAFLKTLEEPPPHVVFVLATTEPHKMPPTILSRCQRYDFRSVPVPLLAEHLAMVAEAEGIEVKGGSLRLIARRARGSARDALVILEQVMSYGNGVVDEQGVAGFLGLLEDEILAELGDHLAGGDAAAVIALVERAYEEGRDLVQFARGAQEHFRRVFLLQHADLSPEDLEVDEAAFEAMRRQARELTPERTFHFIASLREAIREMPASASPRLVLEGALIAMARSELDTTTEALLARLGKLEGEVERSARKTAGEAAAGAIETAKPAAPPREKEAPAVVSGVEEAAAAGGDTTRGGVEDARPLAGDAGAAQLDLAAIRKAWPQVKEKVKERKVTTHAFLLEGKPLAYTGGELLIIFPADRSFHRGELDKKDHREVLEAALEEVLGVPVMVRTGQEETEAGAPRARSDAAAPDRRAERRRGVTAGPGGSGVEADTEQGSMGGEALAANEVEPGPPREEREARDDEERDGERAEKHDAGKVKLVKDIFGAEMIEEIKLNE